MASFQQSTVERGVDGQPSRRTEMTVSVCLWFQLVLRGREGAACAVGGAGTAWEAKTVTHVRGEMAREKDYCLQTRAGGDDPSTTRDYERSECTGKAVCWLQLGSTSAHVLVPVERSQGDHQRMVVMCLDAQPPPALRVPSLNQRAW